MRVLGNGARMLIIGERINATRKAVREAIRARDGELIRKEAADQTAAGAHLLDVNGGTDPSEEMGNVEWLLETLGDQTPPLCVDSSNPEVLGGAADRIAAVRGGAAEGADVPWMMLNSISGERERMEKLLPVVAKHRCGVVALCMDDAGVPEGVGMRVETGKRVMERLEGAGVGRELVYLDPLVLPVSVNPQHAKDVVKTIEELKGLFPEAHVSCGLSNVSYGLPARRLLNRTFLVLAVAAGLDAVIMDPTDRRLMGALRAAMAVAGRDAYCAEYIAAFRKQQLDV